jgi:hypothetical protein
MPRVRGAGLAQPRRGLARSGSICAPLPNFANASARASSGNAQVGTEQPSTAQASVDSGDSPMVSSVSLTAR